jgi:hypothetical protein
MGSGVCGGGWCGAGAERTDRPHPGFVTVRKLTVLSQPAAWQGGGAAAPSGCAFISIRLGAISACHPSHDAIFETDLTHEEADAWRELSPGLRLSERYREKFRASGWEFGASIMDVMRCPCCPKGAKPDPDKAALKAGLVEILGDDEDGIAATMENFGL